MRSDLSGDPSLRVAANRKQEGSPLPVSPWKEDVSDLSAKAGARG